MLERFRRDIPRAIEIGHAIEVAQVGLHLCSSIDGLASGFLKRQTFIAPVDVVAAYLAEIQLRDFGGVAAAVIAGV